VQGGKAVGGMERGAGRRLRSITEASDSKGEAGLLMVGEPERVRMCMLSWSLLAWLGVLRGRGAGAEMQADSWQRPGANPAPQPNMHDYSF